MTTSSQRRMAEWAGGPKARITLSLPPDLINYAKVIATREGGTVSSIVIAAMLVQGRRKLYGPALDVQVELNRLEFRESGETREDQKDRLLARIEEVVGAFHLDDVPENESGDSQEQADE